MVCFKLKIKNFYKIRLNFFFGLRIWPNSIANLNGCPVILKQMPSLEEMPPYGFPVWDPRVKIDQLFYYLKKKKFI